MAYSIPDCFMIAFAAGLIFAVVYELLRIIRVMFPFQVMTFVCDIVFFVIAAGAVTKLSLSLGNYIRIYTVLGFGAGIFTYITTLGRFLNIVENAVAGAVRSVGGFPLFRQNYRQTIWRYCTCVGWRIWGNQQNLPER